MAIAITNVGVAATKVTDSSDAVSVFGIAATEGAVAADGVVATDDGVAVARAAAVAVDDADIGDDDAVNRIVIVARIADPDYGSGGWRLSRATGSSSSGRAASCSPRLAKYDGQLTCSLPAASRYWLGLSACPSRMP